MMNLYTTDIKLRRTRLFDNYESMIWTERFKAFGDFQLVVPSDQGTRTLIERSPYMSMDESNRLMRVEFVEEFINDDGERMLTVKGRSVESRMDERIAIAPTSTTPPYLWRFTRAPAEAMRIFFRETCYINPRNPKDVFGDTTYRGSPYTGAIPEPVDLIVCETKPPKTVYAAIKEIADAYDLGFAMVFDKPNTAHEVQQPLMFAVYTGYDRTSSQTTNRPVIFSSNLDNLSNVKTLKMNSDYRNVCHVISKRQALEVFAPGVSTSISGPARRVVILLLEDIDPELTLTQEAAYMKQKGQEELAKHKPIDALDGEVSQSTQYKYRVDYNLGDLVEMQNVNGDMNQMRVTEQIFVSDGEGQRSYPTLSLHNFIQSGSWLGWDQNQEWAQLTTEEWKTMP